MLRRDASKEDSAEAIFVLLVLESPLKIGPFFIRQIFSPSAIFADSLVAPNQRTQVKLYSPV